MGLKIISVRGVKGKNVWNLELLSDIKDVIKKSLKENGFAIVERKKLMDAYKGTASGRNVSINCYRKLREIVEEISEELNKELSLTYYREVVTEDDKGKRHKYSDVYVIQ